MLSMILPMLITQLKMKCIEKLNNNESGFDISDANEFLCKNGCDFLEIDFDNKMIKIIEEKIK
jgi:hypothetical protein